MSTARLRSWAKRDSKRASNNALRKRNKLCRTRRATFETLETRSLLSSAPLVACIPWTGGTPHETWNGNTTVLKACVTASEFPLNYTWNFGDGTSQSGQITSQAQAYAIEADHAYPNEAVGTPLNATLKVTDPATGLSSSDTYHIVVNANTLSVQADVAVDEGLWYLHKTMTRDTVNGVAEGYWSEDGYSVALTGLAVHAFELEGYQLNGAQGTTITNPYVEDVNLGLNHIFNECVPTVVSWGPGTQCPDGNPCLSPSGATNGNGIAMNISSGDPVYEIGGAMMALAASGEANAGTTWTAQGGPTGVQGLSYYQILGDMVSMCAMGQNDGSGTGSNYIGGWRYGWNYGTSDNSVVQWPLMGLEAAQQYTGITAPSFVGRELQSWLTYSQSSNGGWGYTDPNTGTDDFSHLGTGILGLQYCGLPESDTAIQNGIQWFAANYDNSEWGGTLWDNKYGMYSISKALRLSNPPITTIGGHDWYTDCEESLINGVNPDGSGSDAQITTGPLAGSWPQTSNWSSGPTMDTCFSLLVLEPAVISPPPVAELTVAPGSGLPGTTFTFNATGSYDLDPARQIASYTFNFGDGTSFTETLATMANPSTWPAGVTSCPAFGEVTYDYPSITMTTILTYPDDAVTFNPTVTVTDNNPATPLSSTAPTVDGVQISVQHHPPVAEITCSGATQAGSTPVNGSYIGYAGVPLTFSGVDSYSPDAGAPFYNHVAQYGWQFGQSAPYTFTDSNQINQQWTFNTPGTYNVGLEVTSLYGMTHPGFTDTAWVTVTIEAAIPTQIWINPDMDVKYGEIAAATPSTQGVEARLLTSTLQPIAGMPLNFYLDVNQNGTFSDSLGSATTNAQGYAELPYEFFVTPGYYQIKAVFAGAAPAGSAPYLPSTSLPETYLEIDPAGTVLTYTGDTVGHNGQPASLSAQLTDDETPGVPLAGQTITFTHGSFSVSATTNAAGIATSSVPLDYPVGVYTGNVSYSGDADYLSTTTPVTFTIANTAPTIAPLAAQLVLESSPVTLSDTFVDPDPGQTHAVTINWGDGSKPTTLNLSAGTFAFSTVHQYLQDGPGFLVTVTVDDHAGGVAQATTTVAVNGLAALPQPLQTINSYEGTSWNYQLAGTFTDFNRWTPTNGFYGTINWGDGTTTAFTNSSGNVSLLYTDATVSHYGVSGVHAYAEEGAYQITVTVFDNAGSSVTVQGSKTSVGDAPLSAHPVTVPSGTATAGSSFTTTVAKFTDLDPNAVAQFTTENSAGQPGDYTATINWGDGTTSVVTNLTPQATIGNIVVDGSGFDVAGTHMYNPSSSTSYNVTVSIADVGGSKASVSTTILDPPKKTVKAGANANAAALMAVVSGASGSGSGSTSNTVLNPAAVALLYGTSQG